MLFQYQSIAIMAWEQVAGCDYGEESSTRLADITRQFFSCNRYQASRPLAAAFQTLQGAKLERAT